MTIEDYTTTERNRRRLLELIRELQDNSDRGASIIEVMEHMRKESLSVSEFPRYLASIIREGLAYETDQEHIRTTR